MPTFHNSETGSSGRRVLVAVCAALVGSLGCVKTHPSNVAMDGGNGDQAAADVATGGQAGGGTGGGGAAGADAASSGGSGGLPADAGGGADACTGDVCGAPDVAEQSICGDGKIGQGETCDDHNMVGGDGCSASCALEADWACPAPGEKCVSTVKCNDRKVTGNEQCDDGNNNPGDGCSATCILECGWTCAVGGGCQAARCGDGLLAGSEQCDDGNNNPEDGCSATCSLEGKPVTVPEGWACSSKQQANGCLGPTTCTATVCGNKIVEGSEQCDDMNNDIGDGCAPWCRLEPICPAGGGACVTACGDGLLLAVDKANGQECDDGNTVSGDGCSKTCKVEPGFACMDVVVKPDPLVIPIVFHDFKGWQEPSGHPDFEHFLGNGQAGIIQGTLGAANGGVPTHVPMCMPLTVNLCAPGAANPTWDPAVDWYGMWYVDNATYNKPLVKTLTLATDTPVVGSYRYDNGDFFPIDNEGWGNTPGQVHNFGFTSELRYWFEYNGPATLEFRGDDDLWVFVNDKLAVDLGGLHQALTGSITLGATGGTGYVCDLVTPCDAMGLGGRTVNLGLQAGSVYEIAIFHAERHTVVSNFRLTLTNFSSRRSACVPICGDGIVTANEACDLGTAKNTGAYGTCNPDCTLAPGCGDAKVQATEECDDGVNLTTYSSARKCGPGCKWASYCGDGSIDGMYEQCDQGADNGKGYGFCTVDCKLGPRCGDGIVQSANGEECDLQVSCDNTCKKITVQ